jgi:hypothetical protein
MRGWDGEVDMEDSGTGEGMVATRGWWTSHAPPKTGDNRRSRNGHCIISSTVAPGRDDEPCALNDDASNCCTNRLFLEPRLARKRSSSCEAIISAAEPGAHRMMGTQH